ncbi:MAG: hypothetical protein ACTHWW_10900 [Arthrobacter sp.]|uniref:hypothetical protein n=1 Tax=unclassified Arthrobacter TaxID=235627 RepID=UPI0026526C50|nr:hypothetical protein [Micrococcaceae bacterium]
METKIPGRTGRATLVLEEPWQAESIRDEFELFAYLAGPEGTFAPNLIVTVNPFDGTNDEFLDRAVHGLTTTLQKPYLFDVRIWDKEQSLDDDSVPSVDDLDVLSMGRTIAYTHESTQTRATLRSAEWLFIDSGLAIQVTGTTTTAQWPIFEPTLGTMARSVSTSTEGAS